LLQSGLGIGPDCLNRAFGLTDSAIDAFIRVNDEHVLALVKTIDRTDFDAIHVFALDALVVDNVGHFLLRPPRPAALLGPVANLWSVLLQDNPTRS
jgi:hypothetical protein